MTKGESAELLARSIVAREGSQVVIVILADKRGDLLALGFGVAGRHVPPTSELAIEILHAVLEDLAE